VSYSNKLAVKDEVSRQIEDACAKARKAGLNLEISYKVEDPRKTVEADIQTHLLSARESIEKAVHLAREIGIDDLHFMGLTIKWSFDGIEAAGGIKLFDDWSYSTMECHPSDEAYRWLHGEEADGSG